MLKRIFLALIVSILLIGCAAPLAPQSDSTPQIESTPQSWWKSITFYEIFVRSYYDSDANGMGDFNGITQKLDYIESLGIRALWLMPIFPSPSYHGYDVTDFYSVNPQYGTMDEFKTLINEAHKRDIRIIIDLPLNHTSENHPWFKESKDPNSTYRDWYVWSEFDPKSKGPWGQDVWHPSMNGYYYGIFIANMPDLNYRNPKVTEEMLKVTQFWLKDVGVDGYRLDAVKHLIEKGPLQQNTLETHLWLKNEFYPAVKAAKPEALTIGELFGDNLDTLSLYVKGKQFDSAFHFQLADAIFKSVSTSNSMYVSDMLKFTEKKLPEHPYAPFLTNHDQNRIMSELFGKVDKAKLAAFLMLTSPGTPFIYYGEEIGMKGKKPDEDIRLPMQWNAQKYAGFSTKRPWRAPAKDYEFVNVDLQTGSPDSLLEHYRTLIKLRNSHPALSTGSIIILETNHHSIYAALRVDGNETLLVLANLSDEIIRDYGISLKDAPLTGSTLSVESIYGADSPRDLERDGEAFSLYKPFENLDPYQMIILIIK